MAFDSGTICSYQVIRNSDTMNFANVISHCQNHMTIETISFVREISSDEFLPKYRIASKSWDCHFLILFSKNDILSLSSDFKECYIQKNCFKKDCDQQNIDKKNVNTHRSPSSLNEKSPSRRSRNRYRVAIFGRFVKLLLLLSVGFFGLPGVVGGAILIW